MAKLLELFRHFLLLKALTRGRRGCSEFYHVCSYILHTPNPYQGVAFWCCCCSSFPLREHVANGGWYHTKYIQYYYWWPMFCSRKQWQTAFGSFRVHGLVFGGFNNGSRESFPIPATPAAGWVTCSFDASLHDGRATTKGTFSRCHFDTEAAQQEE